MPISSPAMGTFPLSRGIYMFRRLLFLLPFCVIAAVSLEAFRGLSNSLEPEALEHLATDEGEACREAMSPAPVQCLPYGEDLLAWSEARGIDPALVWAVAMVESSLRTDAVRQEPRLNDASYGLMQILYRTAQEVGYDGEPQGLLDAGTNLEFGTAYLKSMLDRFDGDVRLALAAYNAGPTRVSKLIRRHGPSYENIRPHLPRKTRAYVQRVLDWRLHFEALERSEK